MKKIRYKLLTISAFALIAASVFTGCKRTDFQNNESTQITIDAAVDASFDAQQNVVTKLNSSGFQDGDQISFFAVKYTGSTPNVLGADGSTFISNALYQRNAGLFKHFDGTSYLRDFFPNDGSSIDVYGLYPYASSISDYAFHTFKVVGDQVTDAEDYFNSDLMMAKTTNIAPQAVPTRLVFFHLLTKIEVNIKLKNFPNGTSVESTRLLNIIPDAVVNLTAFDGSTTNVVAGTSPAQTIYPRNVNPAAAGFLRTFTAIVPPQKIVAGVGLADIILDTPNKDQFTLKLKNDFTLQAGMKNVFDVTINFGDRPEIFTNATIIPWNEESYGEGAVDKESEYKFKVILLNEKESTSRTTSVKVGVNGNRTFHLTKIKGYVSNVEDGNAAIYFEFPGDGNRPGEGADVKFSLNRLELFDASGLRFNLCQIDPKIEVTSMGEMTLYYDMAAQTIRTTK